MAEYLIVESSEKAKTEEAKRFTLDLSALTVGKSYQIPFGDVSESNLRTYVSRESKKIGMVFKVVKHEHFQLYEVARIS